MMRLVTGLFDGLNDAKETVRELEIHGHLPSEMNLICGSKEQAAALAREYRHSSAGGTGAVVGAGAGALLGGAGALVMGLAAFSVPGLGPVLAAGTLTAALAGANVGAVAGGLAGGLIGLGVAQKDAYTYEQAIARGGTLLTVRTPNDRYQDAIAVMDRHHVRDVTERAVHH
jgi:hypothetical protein